MEARRIGILTGGGDCPGLNAAIRAITKTALKKDYKVVGFLDGWEGLLYDKSIVLDRAQTTGIIDKGGTIIGASRTSPLRIKEGTKRVFDTFQKHQLQALVVVGGEGTLSIASKLYDLGLPLVGIPKTIDNDVQGTDYTIGFQTAVQIATDALDRLRSTAASHHRVMILEVMGRHTGWIATYAGIASGADAILIPEIPMNKENTDKLLRILKARNQKGINFSVVVVSEGIKLTGEVVFKPSLPTDTDDPDRLGGVGKVLGELIERRTGLHVRISTLDYIQRGGTPVAYDRSLATAFGVKAVNLILENKLGEMTSLQGDTIDSVPLKDIADGIKPVNMDVYKMAETFIG